MTGSIKDKVAIIGMGCTQFGERWDKHAEDLLVDAFTEALEDAGVKVAPTPSDMGTTLQGLL